MGRSSVTAISEQTKSHFLKILHFLKYIHIFSYFFRFSEKENRVSENFRKKVPHHTAMASGPRTPRFTVPSPWTRPKDANSGPSRARKHPQIMTTMANPQGCYLDETCSGLGRGARRPPTRPVRQKPRPGSPPSPSSSKPSPSRAPPRRDDASAGGEGLPQPHRCSKSLPEMQMGSNSPEQLNLHTSP
jgi:hypothetical protein